MTRILDTAETALPPPNFQAFRRVILSAFGRDGLEADILDLIGMDAGTERNGKGRT